MFEIAFTPDLLTLLGILVVAVIFILVGMNRYIASVRRYSISCTAGDKKDISDVKYPSVSVIVYACDDVENLKVLLPQLLTQDYPGPMEVIVVNDGHPAGVEFIVASLESRYRNLYLTYVPDNSRNLSRRKLAITLGVKAARFETIALTCGNCRITSANWLRSMMLPIAQGKEITIGYSFLARCRTNKSGKQVYRSPLSLWKSADTLWNTAAYLSWAIAGRPYRGICHNLVYRKSVFFRNTGFSRSLNLKYGDDDIFVNEIARKDNTSVQLSQQSMVAVMTEDSDAMFKRDRLHYGFTSSYLPSGSRRLFGATSLAWWIAVGSATCLSLAGWPSVIPLIVSSLIILILWMVTAITWRRTSKVLKLPFGLGGVIIFPFIMMFHPFYSLYYFFLGRRHRDSNYTWTRTQL